MTETAYSKDLYSLVKFLPSYAMPNSIPSRRLTSSTVQARGDDTHDSNEEASPDPALLRRFTSPISGILKRRESSTLPVPATSSAGKNTFSIAKRGSLPPTPRDAGMPRRADTIGRDDVDDFLLPAHMPPKYVLLDIFPFSLFIHCMSRDSKHVKFNDARMQARMANSSDNLPLEISLYLVSFTQAHRMEVISD